MMRRRPRKRSQTEGHAAASHHIAAAPVAAVRNGGESERPDRLVPTASRRKRRAFSGKLLRSKSAPYGGGDAGTESIRSDEASPAPPRPSVVAPALQSIGKSDVDDGVPSQSALKDLQRAMKLVADERHLAAHELYLDARRRVEESRGELGDIQDDRQQAKNRRGRIWWKQELQTIDASDEEKAWDFLQDRKEEFEALENRATLFAAAKENLSVDDDWVHAQTLFGVATSYRREADGSLSVKIEGELHGVPLFEQLVVLRECDLYDTWVSSQSAHLVHLQSIGAYMLRSLLGRLLSPPNPRNWRSLTNWTWWHGI